MAVVAGFEDLVRRLGDDPVFHDEVARDPRAKLTGYALNVDELTELARLVEAATASLPPLDQRRSRAGFFALLSVAGHPASASAGAGATAGAAGCPPGPSSTGS